VLDRIAAGNITEDDVKSVFGARTFLSKELVEDDAKYVEQIKKDEAELKRAFKPRRKVRAKGTSNFSPLADKVIRFYRRHNLRDTAKKYHLTVGETRRLLVARGKLRKQGVNHG
jgi:hypothetical protein